MAMCGAGFAYTRSSIETEWRTQIETNESTAARALCEVHEAQRCFHDADVDANGVNDYAPSLAALVSVGALEPRAARFDRWGYRLELKAAPDRSAWMAVARPLRPGRTGERYFAVNERRVATDRKDRHEELPYFCYSYEPISLGPSLRMPDSDACHCHASLRSLHPARVAARGGLPSR